MDLVNDYFQLFVRQNNYSQYTFWRWDISFSWRGFSFLILVRIFSVKLPDENFQINRRKDFSLLMCNVGDLSENPISSRASYISGYSNKLRVQSPNALSSLSRYSRFIFFYKCN